MKNKKSKAYRFIFILIKYILYTLMDERLIPQLRKNSFGRLKLFKKVTLYSVSLFNLSPENFELTNNRTCIKSIILAFSTLLILFLFI